MKRIDAISLVADWAAKNKALLVCNLGFPSRELYHVHDRPENFYMLGSMGLASSIGLGLAIAQPQRKVAVLEGDGAVLMNLSTLATVASHPPENYRLVILDNCSYGSTGSQPTCTAGCTDLAEIAKAAGVSRVTRAHDPRELVQALSCPGVVVAKVEMGNAKVPIIDLSPERILERFRQSVLQAP